MSTKRSKHESQTLSKSEKRFVLLFCSIANAAIVQVAAPSISQAMEKAKQRRVQSTQHSSSTRRNARKVASEQQASSTTNVSFSTPIEHLPTPLGKMIRGPNITAFAA